MNGVSMRNVFGEQLAQIVQQHKMVVALDGDLGNSTKLDAVEKVNPDAYLQMGIAEQNMVSVAAGLAQVGFQPWVCSFATFLTKRAFDQVVVSVAQTNSDVKLIGSYSGLLTSNTGKTHHALEDLAMLSTIPNMVVLAPGDANELALAMKAMHTYKGPVYLRVSRNETIPHFIPNDSFQFGKGNVLREGQDVLIVSTGSMTYEVKKAIDMNDNISITHVHMPSIKPFDRELLLRLARDVEVVITVEEHYIRGGLGSIVAEILSEELPRYVHRMGMQDEYVGCGKDEELLHAYGLSAAHIAKCIAHYTTK